MKEEHTFITETSSPARREDDWLEGSNWWTNEEPLWLLVKISLKAEKDMFI